jgi:uncharacterized protein
MRTTIPLGYRRYSLIIGLSIACLAPSITNAASFDCGKARTRFERTVCADSQLSARDSAMAQRYDDALSSLTEAGQTILRSGQGQWLKVVQRLCLDSKRAEGPTTCMRRQYDDRLDDLRSAAVVTGPFVFSRNDHYASIGQQDSTGIPLEQHTGLPRIDQPRSVVAEQWNAAIVREAAAAQANWCFGEPDTAAEQVVDFKIQSATPGFINVRMLHYELCGLAAGSDDMNNVSYLLTPTLHRLKAVDLFRAETPWASFLANRASRVLNADGDTDFNDRINKDVRDPAAWSFTKPGLVISFNPGDAGPIASGILDVTIPWSDLRRFVTPTAPIPR